MGRNLRTRLPLLSYEEPNELIQNQISHLRHRQKRNYDRGTRALTPLNSGDTVRILGDKKPAKQGRVIDNPSTRSYRVLTEDDRVLRRNRIFLVRTPERFCRQRDYSEMHEPVVDRPNQTNQDTLHEPTHITVDTHNNDRQNQTNHNTLHEPTHITVDTHNNLGITDNVNNNTVSNHINNLHSTPDIPCNDIVDCNINTTVPVRRSTRIKHHPQWTKDYKMD